MGQLDDEEPLSSLPIVLNRVLKTADHSSFIGVRLSVQEFQFLMKKEETEVIIESDQVLFRGKPKLSGETMQEEWYLRKKQLNQLEVNFKFNAKYLKLLTKIVTRHSSITFWFRENEPIFITIDRHLFALATMSDLND